MSTSDCISMPNCYHWFKYMNYYMLDRIPNFQSNRRVWKQSQKHWRKLKRQACKH